MNLDVLFPIPTIVPVPWPLKKILKAISSTECPHVDGSAALLRLAKRWRFNQIRSYKYESIMHIHTSVGGLKCQPHMYRVHKANIFYVTNSFMSKLYFSFICNAELLFT